MNILYKAGLPLKTVYPLSSVHWQMYNVPPYTEI